MEIVSTLFEEDNGYCLSSIRDADKKAGNIAKSIARLKEALSYIQKVRSSQLSIVYKLSAVFTLDHPILRFVYFFEFIESF